MNYNIYLVTDSNCIGERSLLECVEEALKGGVTLVQYRSKETDGGIMYKEALALRELCDKYQVPLIVNDRVDVALAVGAAGVHLGQDDLPCAVARKLVPENFIIGVSAHNVEEALAAQKDGANYLGCGAVFGSQTKNNVSSLGLEKLKSIREAVDIPIVGIGGVTADNYAKVLETGANGAAIVSGILGAQNVKSETEKFVNIVTLFSVKK